MATEVERAPAGAGQWESQLLLPGNPTGNVDMTPEGHITWLELKPGEQSKFYWDGKPGQPFEFIPQHNRDLLAWAPGDRHFGYYGRRSGRFLVGIDDRELGPYDGITRSVPPTWSSDGRRLAFGIIENSRTRLMVDEMPFGDWRPAPLAPAFSPDGSRMAFVAENRELANPAARKGYRQWVVLDGIAGPESDGISNQPGAFGFSPDGRHFVYCRADHGSWCVVLDGVDGPWFRQLGFPTFSPDGSRLVYTAGDPGRMRLVEDGVPGSDPATSFDRIGPPAFSPDGRRLAYVGVRGKGRLSVVVDGQPGPEFAELWGNVLFSPDGQHIAYLAQRRGTGLFARPGTWCLVLDGEAQGEWDEVSSNPHFSPDAKRIAFAARRGRTWSMVVNGAAGVPFDQVSAPTFSSSGRLGYVGVSGRAGQPGARYRFVIEGIADQEVDAIGDPENRGPIQFSRDGAHVACIGRVGHTWRPILDGHVGPAYEGVGRLQFDDDRLHGMAVSSKGVYRISASL